MKIQHGIKVQIWLVLFITLLFPVTIAYSAESPFDIAIVELTPVHIRVTNSIVAPANTNQCQVYVFNRLPLPTPWSNGPENMTWNLPGGRIQNDNELSNSSIKEISKSFQCQPYPGQVMAWLGTWDISKPVPLTEVTCDYDLVLARRIFNARKYQAITVNDLENLPESLRDEVESVQQTLDPAIVAMAREQIAFDNRLITFLQAASDFCGKAVNRGVVDSKGKPISRYDANVTFQERRGWCGPQSSLFRAFCIAVGIPAREASGYALKRIDLTDGEINMSDTRGVPDPRKDGNAHVWAEVFFPDVGWIEINIGAQNCFDIPATFIKVSGIEAPHISYRNGQQYLKHDPFSPHITVTRQ